MTPAFVSAVIKRDCDRDPESRRRILENSRWTQVKNRKGEGAAKGGLELGNEKKLRTSGPTDHGVLQYIISDTANVRSPLSEHRYCRYCNVARRFDPHPP